MSKGRLEAFSDGVLAIIIWLSLTPFVTAWMGENAFAPWPVALYGVVLLLAAGAYFILARVLVGLHGSDSTLGRALGADFKGRISIVFYLMAIGVAFMNRWVSVAIYVLVAVMWLVPDRRIERSLAHD